MTNDPGVQRWRELSWRRKLTPAEEAEFCAWLATCPEARIELEAEVALAAALAQLPDVPLSSNFTARVLQAVGREATAQARPPKWLGWQPWKRWLPKMALGALAITAGLFSYREVWAIHRAKLAQSVVVVSKVSSLPSPAILEDFDAIQRLSPAPVADEQLLSLLQ